MDNNQLRDVSRKFGLSFSRAAEAIREPLASLKELFGPAAALTFLSFTVTSGADASLRNYNAFLSGTDRSLAGVSFAHAFGDLRADEFDKKKREEAFDYQFRLLTSMHFVDIQNEIIDEIIAQIERGEIECDTCAITNTRRIHREDMDTFMEQYMRDNYGIKADDPHMHRLRDAVELELENHDIQVVLLDFSDVAPIPSTCPLDERSVAAFAMNDQQPDGLSGKFARSAILSWTTSGGVMRAKAHIHTEDYDHNGSNIGMEHAIA